MGKLQGSSLTPREFDLSDLADSFVNFHLRKEVAGFFYLPFKTLNVFAHYGFT